MRIQVIGAGVVGQATGRGFARLGHSVEYSDMYKEGYNKRPLNPAGVYMICTPEAAVEEVVTWLQGHPLRYGEGLLVIRSSVPPGTCRGLRAKYQRHICSNPEFLREAVAEYEFLNPPGIIIGECCKEHGAFLEELYTPFRKPIYRTTPEVAELTKLAVNGYLACQISYWNQVRLLADEFGINSHEVGMLATFGDERVSVYGSRMHGRSFGGKCLPKDLNQLLKLATDKGANSTLFEAIKAINDYYLLKGGE